MRSEPHSPTATATSTPPLVDLKELWRRKWFIGKVTLLMVALGVGYLLVTPKTYEVNSRVMVRRDNPSLDPQRPGDADREFLATQAEIIRSPLIIRQALEQVTVSVPSGYAKGDVAFVLELLRVTPIIQTDVLKISYRGQDPQQAKNLIAALVDQYQQHVQQADRGRNAEDLQLLTSREAQLRQQLEALQDQYTNFRRGSPLIGAGRDSVAVQSEQLSHIGQRLSDVRNRRVELENVLQTYQVARSPQQAAQGPKQIDSTGLQTVSINTGADDQPQQPTPQAVTANDPARNVLRDPALDGTNDLAQIEAEIWKAKTRVQELSSRFGAKHPDMRAAEEQVAYWQQLLDQRVQAAESGLAHQLEAAKVTETKLQQLYDQERRRVKQLDDFLVEEAALAAKITRTEETHAATLARLKEYQLTEQALQGGRSSVVVRILDGSDLQEQAIWPQTKALLGLFGMLGIVGGVVLVSLRNGMSQREPADVTIEINP